MFPEINHKQFVIIPKELEMSPGKIASQACHATFMALEQQRVKNRDMTRVKLIEDWKKNGMCVIVLECEDCLQLMGIAEYLRQWHIPYHLYLDEGITEVAMGTPTALATGVMTREQFWMLSQLKLYTEKRWFE